MDFLKFLKEPLREILQFIYNFTGSWGWSIILLTLLLKLILFPTSVKQFKVMSKMKELQPKMKEIQEKYKDNPEEYQRRTMELYQKEKVNPFGSCLPMILQMIVLVGFYQLLQDPKFLKTIGDSSFLWFSLKEKKDIILAVISGATTFFQQKLTMPATGNDPQQQTFLYIMPLMLAWFTYTVNAGIGLYWVTGNIFGIIQQYMINEYFLVKEHIKDKNDGK